ncbi:ABC transporter ATP-binding protein [Athalassotoga saccharophila]|uniref:ABC transporter ATP-binding protein n=1 Tax=Athalassotoga saccharophila TaxID=1441386 RepID=UPI001379E281|nr:ABC transporter ATP-binding protein [Athalassotoga saccharophila]BBJ28571.1 daunorubicin/doxorubicin resistance ATP-binding protein DrrA [Athalassotoga saccharophila]
MRESILEVENLKKYYSDIKAVDGISFKVLKGEVFALLGPNGAGKTTTLEILEGLKDYDGGKIKLFGEEVRGKVPRHLRERIGVVLQENNFIDHLTTVEILKMFRSLYSNGIDVREVLKEISLEDKANAKVEKLSGGQRQRLAIGTALVGNPELIFMDEPTTGLDPQARRNVWEMIEKLREKGKTVFLTTHYMEEAEYLADYIYVMDHGKIIAKGSAEELISSFGGEKIIEIDLDSKNLDLSFLSEFQKTKIEDSKIIIVTSSLPTDMKKALDLFEERSIKVNDIIVRQPNLEDVFLNLTGRKLRD